MAAYLWRNAPADTGRLSALVGASYVRDRRILDAVTAVATDPARPQLVRLAALRILAIYGDPHLLLEWSDLEPPPVIGGLVQGRNLPHIGHPYAPDGPQPLTAADAQAIRQSLDLLSRSDADERVRGAAESIIYALRLYDRARE
ncbi:MAG TPA: hypothetical protein VKA84_20365 [Gemmatimonadaceae bacterium]|nr:hypothetical protein [Gemmatimonadaceae bacterium]